MYFEAYLSPPLHANIPLKELNIDRNVFSSYEEYIGDMFKKDFASYGKLGKPKLHYLQLRQKDKGHIVGVCVVLHQEKHGYYYLDHIGIDSHFRKKGLATQLLEITASQLSGFIEISLDTRVLISLHKHFTKSLVSGNVYFILVLKAIFLFPLCTPLSSRIKSCNTAITSCF
ncbi:MAG: GNAT family N-acetyltransferase [Parachlamydiaceae bacterium]|nr:GNAT family N-acetyltransferase [Parachlamydiaceae bacterium]